MAINDRQLPPIFSRFYHLYQYFLRILRTVIYGHSHFLRRILDKGSSWVYQLHYQCSLEHCWDGEFLHHSRKLKGGHRVKSEIGKQEDEDGFFGSVWE